MKNLKEKVQKEGKEFGWWRAYGVYVRYCAERVPSFTREMEGANAPEIEKSAHFCIKINHFLAIYLIFLQNRVFFHKKMRPFALRKVKNLGSLHRIRNSLLPRGGEGWLRGELRRYVREL